MVMTSNSLTQVVHVHRPKRQVDGLLEGSCTKVAAADCTLLVQLACTRIVYAVGLTYVLHSR